jgi:glycosyltransferase involved in cell wall biosynthesis
MEVRILRVLHVVATAEPRGAEIFAAGLIRSLDGATVDQRVAILRDAGLGAGVNFQAPHAALSRAERAGPFDLRLARRLGRLHDAWRPEIVQLHGGEPLKYAAAARILGSSASVYRRIGGAPAVLQRPIRRRLHGALMRRADRTVAVADALSSEAVDFFGVPSEKVTVIPNGVDASRMTPTAGRAEVRRSLGLSTDSTVILSLGALTWEKDPILHLDVTTAVSAGRPDTYHVFAGDGPMRGEVECAVRNRSLGGRVLILGGRDDVANILAASDVLLFASRPDGMEGMPASLIEAGMSGIPVIGFDVAGASEVVVDAETGFLIPWGDVAGLLGRLGQVLDDADLRVRLGAAARDRCCSTFDMGVIAPRYLSLYEELV